MIQEVLVGGEKALLVHTEEEFQEAFGREDEETITILPGRWCMNRNWPTTNPTHRSITYQERTTMAYRARPSG